MNIKIEIKAELEEKKQGNTTSCEIVDYTYEITRKIQREIEKLFIQEGYLMQHKQVTNNDEGATIDYQIEQSLKGE